MHIIREEPYTTRAGRRYVLVQYADPEAPDGLPREFWSWRDEKGYGPSLGWLANRHATREAAIERLEAEDWIRFMLEGLPLELSRKEYESACERAGVTPWTDKEIMWAGYSLRYGEFALPEYTPQHIVTMELARRRLKELANRTSAGPTGAVRKSRVLYPAGTTPADPAKGTGRCVVCGVPDSYWNAGAASYRCARHWDEY